jgi:hypothetical protein
MKDESQGTGKASDQGLTVGEIPCCNIFAKGRKGRGGGPCFDCAVRGLSEREEEGHPVAFLGPPSFVGFLPAFLSPSIRRERQRTMNGSQYNKTMIQEMEREERKLRLLRGKSFIGLPQSLEDPKAQQRGRDAFAAQPSGLAP